MMEIKVLKNILQDNMYCAMDNNKHFKDKGVKVFNILASPGAGKTSFLINIADCIGREKIAVIEGDIESSIDTEKLINLGINAIQINTGGVCHLDANMIGHAIPQIEFKSEQLLFIENVGNLVCTAPYDLGEDKKILVLSVTEGADKPFKYPLIFEKADVIILNKMDLLPYVEFDKGVFYKVVRALNGCPIFEVSCTTGQGIEEFIKWLNA